MLAERITAIAIAVSVSTSSVISVNDELSCAAASSTRSTVSSRAGIRLTASKAAARRWPPLPSPRKGRLDALCRCSHRGHLNGTAGTRDGSLPYPSRSSADATHPVNRSRSRPRGAHRRAGRSPDRASMRRPLAAERGERVEDPRRDGRAGDRDPDRLVDVAAACPGARPLAELRLERRRVEGLGLARSRSAPLRARPAPGSITFRQAFSDHRPAVEQERDQRPDLGQRLRLVLGDRAGRARAASGPRAASAWPSALEVRRRAAST